MPPRAGARDCEGRIEPKPLQPRRFPVPQAIHPPPPLTLHSGIEFTLNVLRSSSMAETYTIGHLAKVAEVPISTVRYYEQRGLLRPERRTESNYRVYGPASLKRLRFIRIAQQSGFTLEDLSLIHISEPTRPY